MRGVLHNNNVDFEEWQRDAIDGLHAQAVRRHKLLDELHSKHTGVTNELRSKRTDAPSQTATTAAAAAAAADTSAAAVATAAAAATTAAAAAAREIARLEHERT